MSPVKFAKPFNFPMTGCTPPTRTTDGGSASALALKDPDVSILSTCKQTNKTLSWNEKKTWLGVTVNDYDWYYLLLSTISKVQKDEVNVIKSCSTEIAHNCLSSCRTGKVIQLYDKIEHRSSGHTVSVTNCPSLVSTTWWGESFTSTMPTSTLTANMHGFLSLHLSDTKNASR